MKKNKQKAGKRKKRRNVAADIVLVVAIVVLIISSIQLVRALLPYFEGGAEYDGIKELAIHNPDSSDEIMFQVDFKRLRQINPDTVAWLRFEEPAIISYPVVQTTDNQRYLTQTFQANDNKLGAIFMHFENRPNFTDRNTFIFGHNLKVGGEMFSQLKNYEDEEFYKKYPYFYIYAPDDTVKKYEIFSAGVVKSTAENYNIVYNTDEEYEQYLELAKHSSSYDTGVKVSKDSRIVSLSTCTNVREDERFLVQGVLVEEKYIQKD